MFAIVLGVVLGCQDGSQCDEIADCDECRYCATQLGHGCHSAYRACALDPACDDLWGCVDECWVNMEGESAVFCERTCRGTTGGEAVVLYDEYMFCLEDACTLSCEW